MPPMVEGCYANEILNQWAKKPLDFDPGTKWQYSNTNYVIAGLVIEKVSGMPLMRFLQLRVFTPLDMKSVYNSDEARLTDRRRNRILPPRAGAATNGSERRHRLVVRGGRACHACV